MTLLLYFSLNLKEMKLGIVGTGFIVQEVISHFSSWRIIVNALCSTQRSFEQAKEITRLHNIKSVYSDLGEMLLNADIDTVYIATPNSLHFIQTKQALLAGKNVITEKPFTSNVKEAKELAAIAHERRLLLFEAVSTLHLASYHKIKEWIPRIGTVKLVTMNFSQYSRRYDSRI